MEKKKPITMLYGELVELGPIRRDLLETYQRWFNDLDVIRTLANPNVPTTLDAEEKWLDYALSGGDHAIFTIYVRENGQPIGNASLERIDHFHGTANFGIVIGEKSAWNKGYGKETTKLLLAYGFDILGLQNILLSVYATNPAAIRVYEAAGFKKIGTRRSAFCLGRERTDVILMDATPDDIPPSGLQRLLVDGPPRD